MMQITPCSRFTPSKKLSFFNASSAVALSTALFAALPVANAATLYWNVSEGNWTTSTGATDWSGGAGDPATLFWANGSDADIVSTNASINMWNVTARNVTIRNDATFSASGGATAGRGLTVNGAGSGNFSLVDLRTSGTGNSLYVFLNGTSAWDGRISASGSEYSRVGLVISGNQGGGVASTGVATRVHLADGGNLLMGSGTVGQTATIGELSGNGNIRFQGQFSTTGGTRRLRVEQNTNTLFTGTLGENLTRQDHVLAFTKAGTGTLVVNGSGGYEGSTIVEGGKLSLSGVFGKGFTGVSGQGDYIVHGDATLSVDGELALATTGASRNVIINDGGRLKPGTEANAGTMLISGGGASDGLIFEGGAVIEFRIGADQDLIVLDGSGMNGVANGGTGSILFDFINNQGVVVGETYDLISFGGTGIGIGLDSYALSSQSITNGWNGEFSYGGDGNMLRFTVSAVPEPAHYALIGSAALGLFVYLRRKRGSVK